MSSKYLHETSMKTHIGIGPMSKNCVDATIELAYENKINLMLIASRRQIECSEFGGGYVNNWDTNSFAKYVKDNDPDNRIILARDHGGPWQHPLEWEKCITIEEAMKSAKLSYLRDIEAGFQVIHIDPVLNNGMEEPSLEWILDKIYELYEYCFDVAKKLNKEIMIEIGTEEQGVSPVADPILVEELLDNIFKFCEEKELPKPTFLVVQTGTKVMGMKNIGDFPNLDEEINEYINKHKFLQIINICEKHGVKIKEHNADYLSDTSLKIHPIIGIHSVNVAPEFGVAETIALLSIMKELSASKEIDEFIKICIDSNRWAKWVIGIGDVSDLEKAKICGHYLFSDKRVIKIKKEIMNKYFEETGKDLELYLKEHVKVSITRYLKNFNLMES
jgi:hypothetical protein